MRTVYLPTVQKGVEVSAQVSDEEFLFWLIRTSPFQKRLRMIRHELLDKAAQNKAEDMAAKDYFSHTSPEGITANENVRSVGYELPDFYPLQGNNVESLSIGGWSVESVADGWLNSPKHRPHVYGELDFYFNQQCIGIGSALNQKDERPIYVFISAPCG